MRYWVKDHPVSKKRMIPGSVVKTILDKEITADVHFELRDDANPESRKRGLQRWKDMPENWGPMSRAKTSPEKEQPPQEKKPKLKDVCFMGIIIFVPSAFCKSSVRSYSFNLKSIV
jgi:tRNA (guanine26-N2/guanine27-N2)-dimethyltransferase